MPKETVIVDGKKRAGFIVTDFLSTPMQVWFVFESEELQQKYGHRLVFTFTAGKPEPQDKELAAKYPDLFRQIEKLLQHFVFKH